MSVFHVVAWAALGAAHTMINGNSVVENVVEQVASYEPGVNNIYALNPGASVAVGPDRVVGVTRSRLFIRKTVAETELYNTSFRAFWNGTFGAPPILGFPFESQAVFLEQQRRFVVTATTSVNTFPSPTATLVIDDGLMVQGAFSIMSLGDFTADATAVRVVESPIGEPLANAADVKNNICVAQFSDVNIARISALCDSAGAVATIIVDNATMRFPSFRTPGATFMVPFESIPDGARLQLRKDGDTIGAQLVVAVSNSPYPRDEHGWRRFAVNLFVNDTTFRPYHVALSHDDTNVYASIGGLFWNRLFRHIQTIVALNVSELQSPATPTIPSRLQEPTATVVYSTTTARRPIDVFWLSGTLPRRTLPHIDCTPLNVTFFVGVSTRTNTALQGFQTSLRVLTYSNKDGSASSVVERRVDIGEYGSAVETPGLDEIRLNWHLMATNVSVTDDRVGNVYDFPFYKTADKCVLQQTSLWCVLTAAKGRASAPETRAQSKIVWVELDVSAVLADPSVGNIELVQRGDIEPPAPFSANNPAIDIDTLGLVHITYTVYGVNQAKRTEHTIRFPNDPHNTLRMPATVSTRTQTPFLGTTFELVRDGTGTFLFLTSTDTKAFVSRHPTHDMLIRASECPPDNVAKVTSEQYYVCLVHTTLDRGPAVPSRTYIPPAHNATFASTVASATITPADSVGQYRQLAPIA